ncbi:MAG: hypothetical protein RMJ54_12510 [Roseiflexaceae bacterium]|nr:hypothetical protein [Roseiflexaceae bacterium]
MVSILAVQNWLPVLSIWRMAQCWRAVQCQRQAAGGAAASLDAMLAILALVIGRASAPSRHDHAPACRFPRGPVAADGRTVRLSMHVAGWENLRWAARALRMHRTARMS